MSIALLVFVVFAAIAVCGGVGLIAAREPIHSALALILVMVSLAVLYLTLGAAFIAAVQMIVYAGAIMVLFVFVIMLLNAGQEERSNVSRLARYVGLPLGIFLLLHLAYWTARGTSELHTGAGSAQLPTSTKALSLALFRRFLFPFEATSILILIAILGAVVLAKRER